MKFFVITVVCLFVEQTVAMQVMMGRKNGQSISLKHSLESISSLTNSGMDTCPLCIDFADECIDLLEDITLDVGVIDSCALLCSLLASKTGSPVLGYVCNFFCDIEGVKEFVKIIQKVDLDDIYFCELLRSCPIFDEGDARITLLRIRPVSGPQGKREINFAYTTKNGTGTGQVDVQIKTVDKFPIETRFLNEATQPGTYTFRMSLDAEKDQDCDPSKVPCETWKKGNYTLTVAVCNGECGSKHPHSNIYDIRSTVFTLTD